MTSTEWIESHCSVYLWGDKSADDIGGFDAPRVGLSQEATVVRLGGTPDPTGPR